MEGEENVEKPQGPTEEELIAEKYKNLTIDQIGKVNSFGNLEFSKLDFEMLKHKIRSQNYISEIEEKRLIYISHANLE